MKTKQTILAQLIARAVIFFLFLLAIFIVVPALRYLFILFIIVNLVLGFINGKRNLPTNIALIILTPSLFIPVLEYLTTIILVILLGVHLLMFYLWYKNGRIEKVKDKKKRGEEEGKTRWWSKWWIILLVILAGVVLLLIAMALLFFSVNTVGTVQ